MRCYLPAVEVPAAHAAAVCIFPRRCAAFLKGFTDLDDVDESVNGLVLLKPLKVCLPLAPCCAQEPNGFLLQDRADVTSDSLALLVVVCS